MIRIPNELETENMKINVYLKSGEEFKGKDLPPQPITDQEMFVSFWDGDIIKMFPLENIHKIEYYFDIPERRLKTC